MNYYVDSQLGKDSNSGCSKEEPLKTLSMVNQLILQPGDRVLLKCGSIFQDQGLVIKACGEENNPIVFSTYGQGNRPQIITNGNATWVQDYGCDLDAKTHINKGLVSSSVLIFDSQYLIIEGLEMTNADVSGENISLPHRMNRTGVAIVAKDKGDCHDIVIQDLYIHDIHGNVYDKHMCNGGIYAVCEKPEEEEKTGIARFIGLKIINNVVCNCMRWGIAAGYTYRHSDYVGTYLSDDIFEKSGMLNMTIAGNYTENIGGDGITAMYALRPMVKENVSVGCGRHMNAEVYTTPLDRRGMVAAGIWPWKCKDSVFFRNEVYDTALNQDGMAYDCDSGDGTTYYENYSFGNEGGTVMYCLSEAVNSVFKNNRSEKDLLGIIVPVENPDGLFEGNTINLIEGVPLIRNNISNIGKYDLKNNVITQEKYED